MKVLITGGCGFVGRHFACKLAKDHDVVVVDNMSAGLRPDEWEIRRLPIRFILEDCREYFQYATPDDFNLIVHCAAVVGGRLTIEGDPLAVATDLAIDADFFNWAVRSERATKIIYFSSSAVYPIEMQAKNMYISLSENLVHHSSPQFSRPDMTYGWSKLSGEVLAWQAKSKYGKDVRIFRPFSGYGEDQALDYPFPSIMQRVARREDPLVIWGSGQQVRDFIHIDDVVDGVLSVSNKLVVDDTVNLGSGVGTTFLQLAALACTLEGYSPALFCDSSKPEGVFRRVANIDRMQNLYAPQITLKQGVRRALDFFKARV